MITAWWTALSISMKVLWGVTLSATLVFLIQTILSFLGAGHGLDDLDVPDADFSADSGIDGTDSGMNLYTFRNLINFILGFGWTSILLMDKIKSTALLFILAALVGVALVALVMYMFKWLSGMQQSGNINIQKQAVGCQGKVYLTIPAERNGLGKVQISINNSVREYDAITDGDAIPTGKAIKVVEVINNSTLLVEELNSLII